MDERVVSLRLQVGERVLTVICAYAPNTSSEYPPFLESLEKILESAFTGDSIILLGDFNAHVGNDSAILEGRDWEEQTARPEPKWCTVIRLLC